MNNIKHKEHVREKILNLLKEFVNGELENRNEIPKDISAYLLKNYGWAHEISLEKSQLQQNDVETCDSEFVERLEAFIEEKYQQCYERESKNEAEVEEANAFLAATEKLENSKNDFFRTHMEMIKMLVELTRLKIEYSHYLKKKSLLELSKVDDLEKRLETLKLQSAVKFYGESSGYDALVLLKQLLESEKKQLEFYHNELIQQDSNYERLKGNHEYCELLKIYKELSKQEKRLDAMNEA